MLPRKNMRTPRNKYPLRMVIERTGDFQVKLECGHTANPSTDIYGETNPVRQRCRKCYEEDEKNR